MKPRCSTAIVMVVIAFAACNTASAQNQALTVCMSGDNVPLSYTVKGESRGLDVRLAQAVADELGRPLKVVPFESKYDQDSTLSQEVNAMLSSGVCDIASGFSMLATDLGPPTRATARVPDYPGAKRPPQRAWVPLRTLVASRAYHAMAMGLVVRDPAREGATLADPGDARIGAVTGTLSGTAVSMYRNGRLRKQVVSLSQNQDVLEQLEAGRFDATLVALDRLDAWRIGHPDTALRRAAYVHPFRINIGFVATADATEVLAATNRVLDRALANGDLQRWSAEAGVTWVEPATPQVGAAFGLAALVQE
jgi:ABC-type amino acid transport substrate-binding protein